MSRARSRLDDDEGELHNDERWAVSYLDMVTVLMVLFIILFAMSSVDAAKFEQLRNSMATGFGQVEQGDIDTAEGVVVPPDLAGEEGEGFTELEMAMMEVQALQDVQAQIEQGLAEQGLSDTVRFDIDERGLTVRLVSSDTFFESESDRLSDQARSILGTVGPVLATTEYQVSVEGHADHLHPSTFATNWELSSARATQVVRHMIDNGGLAPRSVAAVGFGDSRPLAEGGDVGSLAMNRRVDVVVLSTEPEVVRALIPQVVAGTAEAAAAEH